MKKFIAFFEIPTVDFHRAVDFYETVFGVQLPVFECEEEKMACFTEEGETVGAIFHAPDYLPSEKGVIISFNCEDIDQTLEKSPSERWKNHDAQDENRSRGQRLVCLVCG